MYTLKTTFWTGTTIHGPDMGNDVLKTIYKRCINVTLFVLHGKVPPRGAISAQLYADIAAD